MSAADRIAPTEPSKRLHSVDTVRGFALFGVLLVNMFNFGAWSPEWTEPADRVFASLMHAVFETKSWRLFALLFGLGFALQLARIEASPSASLWLYFRRLSILFVFGMAHALVYDGDILMEYALLGLVLVAFRNVRGPVLIALSCLLLGAFPLGNLIYSPAEEDSLYEREDEMTLAELRVDHPYLGSPLDVFEENRAVIPPRIWTNLNDPESGLAIFSMFLLGYWIGRSGLLHKPAQRLSLVRRAFVWGILIGVASALLEWWLTRAFGYAAFSGNEAPAGIRLLGDMLFAYGSTALALGLGTGIFLLAQKPGRQPLLQPLRNLGRMALTVYLGGTVMFSLLFYGWGFGQLFLLGPAATTAWAALFFALQIAFSSWWMDRFRFGPAEWLWRSLTYRQVQPIRLGPSAQDQSRLT